MHQKSMQSYRSPGDSTVPDQDATKSSPLCQPPRAARPGCYDVAEAFSNFALDASHAETVCCFP